MKKILIPVITVVIIGVAFLLFYPKEDSPKEPLPEEKYAELSENDAVNTSSSLIGEGKLEEAAELLNEKISKNPENPLLHYNLGVAFMQQKNYEKAIEAFTQSLEQQKNIGALNNRAYSYTMLNEVDRAIADYTELIELKDDFAIAFLKRAQLYISKEMKDEAKVDLQKASDLGLRQADALLKTLE